MKEQKTITMYEVNRFGDIREIEVIRYNEKSYWVKGWRNEESRSNRFGNYNQVLETKKEAIQTGIRNLQTRIQNYQNQITRSVKGIKEAE